MFKAVDPTRPWRETGLTSATWLDVPVVLVDTEDLIATQDGIYLQPLIEPTEPFGGDPEPHVVSYRGELYLEDGHHRVVREMLLGERFVPARLFSAADPQGPARR